ncbi:MAG: carboxylating nicotinate-nucleotide diphosphorylase [Dehalococcoidia bacterium]|nr:MAG: carboxylating nicotinate-nucleotide diphosphorylase [Dehalococcoidia bacterium]
MSKWDDEQVDRIIELALIEDINFGDITSRILISPDKHGWASIEAGESGLLVGGDVARKVFLKVEPTLEVDVLIKDGKQIKKGERVITVSGMATGILKAERVALNFLSHLSGVASQTAKYVNRIKDTNTIIRDTRKTLPGMRLLEKIAVKLGGGQNHRLHLGDGILIKDNHIAILRQSGMSLGDIVAMVKRKAPKYMEIEIEVNEFNEALEAATAGVDIIMLDNMSVSEMKQVAVMLSGDVRLEASGGVNLENVYEVAKAGVDFISVGSITHSAKSLDFTLVLKLLK